MNSENLNTVILFLYLNLNYSFTDYKKEIIFLKKFYIGNIVLLSSQGESCFVSYPYVNIFLIKVISAIFFPVKCYKFSSGY